MPQLNNLNTKYRANANYYNSDLAKIIPPIQYAYFNITGTNSIVDSSIPIKNYNNSSNYFVLSSFLSNSPNTSGSYNAAGLVTALGQPVIYYKLPGAFGFYMNKSTGDNTNIYICFTIIYYG